MIPTRAVFQRGETVMLALDVQSGDSDQVTGIVAKLRRLPVGNYSLKADADVAATFTVVPRAASGLIAEGWDLTIPAATSAALTAGQYLADARIEIAGVVVTTNPIIVEIREPATVTAGAGVP